jgi:oxygen-dependent protoporphyrinogen oxidase
MSNSLPYKNPGYPNFDYISKVKTLGLESDVLTTSKNSAGAINRYIYYPDRLCELPHPSVGVWNVLWTILTSPVLKGAVSGFLFEKSRPRRQMNLEDESIGSFLTRRLGSSDIVDNLASAGLHGIYAGDIYQLSAKSLMPWFWEAEGKYGSCWDAYASYNIPTKKDRQLVKDLGNKLGHPLTERMREASVYTFKGGLGTFANAMVTDLRQNPQVEFKLEQNIRSLDYDSEADAISV